MHPTTVLEPQDTTEVTVQDVPVSGQFVPCAQCRHRSYMHFYFMNDFLSYCAHHGVHNKEKLEAAGGKLVADHRDDLTNR